jgi:ribose-phosphate pyrophosphokinase
MLVPNVARTEYARAMNGRPPAILLGNCPPELATGLAARLATKPSRVQAERFPDGELRIALESTVRGQRVFLVHSLGAPTGEHLLELALTADAANRAGALEVIAIIPYLGYARQDRRPHEGEPLGAAVVANLLAGCRIQRVVTVDIHTAPVEGFFSCPVENLSAEPLLAHALRPHVENAVVVSPDLGAVKLARRYAVRLGLPLAVVHKTRIGPRDVTANQVTGDVRGRRPIIVDDMISTGATIVAALDAVVAAGATGDAVVAATHGVFAPGAAGLLASKQIRKIIVTDSVEPFAAHEDVRAERVSLAELIADAISCLVEQRSLEALLAVT